MYSTHSVAGTQGGTPPRVSLPYKGVVYHPGITPVAGYDQAQVSFEIHEVPDDPYAQVREVIGLMKRYANEDSSSLGLLADAQRATVSGDPISDTWNYVKRGGLRGMRFVRDEETVLPFSDYEYNVPGTWRPFVEAISRPVMLAQSDYDSPIGDCDCFATYGAAHLISKGVDCAFVTVAADSRDPELFSHVYLVAYPRSGAYAGRRVPLDLSHGPFPGWEVERVFKREEWPVCGGMKDRLLLLAGLIGAGIFAYTAWNRKGVFHPSLWRTV